MLADSRARLLPHEPPSLSLGPLVGRSAAMRGAFALLERTAPADATVLIEGETGTGKEGAAQALHAGSPRRNRQLIVVDCAAIPASLMESELFGHVKGSFTSAVTSRTGAFEEAEGGTLLLDEIGELPLELQPKLLRALERKEIRRVGTSHMRRLDVRVLAATHRNLRDAVERGAFRADLYFRLSVVRITLPPLRERLEDIPLLVPHLLASMGAAPELIAALTRPDFLAGLARHSWPGNVRELRNFLERCAIFRQPLAPEEERRPPHRAGTFADGRKRAIDDYEREYLAQLMNECAGQASQAARRSGLGRSHFYRLLQKHGVPTSPGRPRDLPSAEAV